MIKLLTVIGARPQIIKAAALSRAINIHFPNQIQEVILHTGQHYDTNMSDVFFREMGIPAPVYQLDVGSGIHGAQTARMIEGIEQTLLIEKPDFVVLYGDTNSTLAGSIAASKLHIPIVHIEAGLRSFNKRMPEEINRIVCDHTSTLLFTPTTTGYTNLIREGFTKDTKAPYTIDNPCIFHCGDVMYDNSIYFAGIAEKSSTILHDYHLTKNNYILATIHRDNNTDDASRLNNLFAAIYHISEEENTNVIIPLHPRTNNLLEKTLEKALYKNVIESRYIQVIQPVSFFDMIALEKNSMIIMTDSGGVQKEAYFYQKPSIILRHETEWTEIIEHDCGKLGDADITKIIDAFHYFKNKKHGSFPAVFGNGKAAEFIGKKIIECNENK